MNETYTRVGCLRVTSVFNYSLWGISRKWGHEGRRFRLKSREELANDTFVF